jgi:hypothetical protein
MDISNGYLDDGILPAFCPYTLEKRKENLVAPTLVFMEINFNPPVRKINGCFILF